MNMRSTVCSPGTSTRSGLLARHFLVLAITWVVVVAGLAVIDFTHVSHTREEMAMKEARANFDKDQALRLWATSHGGVYVPVSEDTPPNPHLSHLPYRDIPTPEGKTLTLMNPAYMLRQVMDQYAEFYGIRGHITSLKPVGPETAPDAWERAALERFERGEEEVTEFTEIKARPYIRLMRPLRAKEECVDCHAGQGLKAGDVRGGVSIAVPMTPYRDDTRRELVFHGASFGILLFIGLSGLRYARRSLMHHMQKRDEAEAELMEAHQTLKEHESELSRTNVRLKSEVVERARAEEALRIHTQKLRASNRALEQFAAMASHDLQEPLRKVLNFGDLLKRRSGVAIDPVGLDYLDRMQKSAKRMRTLIDALLDYSRVTTKAEPFESVDLNGVIHDVLEDLEIRIRETEATLEVGELPALHADPNQMHQLFLNLVGNALKFRRDGEKPHVLVSSRRNAEGFTELHVEDNGIGFNEDDGERIFLPFERLRDQGDYEGSGMGLAICRQIVERHGGDHHGKEQT